MWKWCSWSGRVLVAIGFAAMSSCGGDDNAFPGVTRWECYADSALAVCDCYGLGPNDELVVGGSNITPVPNCGGYAVCASYRDDFGDVLCSCGAAGYTPPTGSTEISPAQQCPP